MYIYCISEVIKSGGQIDVIFIDFKKTFYTVNHNVLVNELYLLGIG